MFFLAAEGVLLHPGRMRARVALVQVLVFSMAAWLQANYGWQGVAGLASGAGVDVAGAVMLAGLLASLVPARRAYRQSLADGMMVRM